MLDAPEKQDLILVTGPSGAGRTTAVRALEDIGFEVIDNLPLSLLDRLIEGSPLDRPLALGLDVRNRDFTVNGVIDTIDRLGVDPRVDLKVLFLDCADDVLIRRFSETRRRHPLADSDDPIVGIRKEKELMQPIRTRAEFLIDTSAMSPHEARLEVQRWFSSDHDQLLSVATQSFSYKRGLPRGLDFVFDCRFLRNPHWDPELRALDGTTDDVQSYVTQDERFAPFFNHVKSMIELLLPAFRDAGKTHLSIGFGCTGGQHRSVTMTELLSKALADDGWRVSKRHREIERQTETGLADRGEHA
ncbi:RNase adaptor protein RapZ [Marivivens niveibacter]|uniref:RNase adaptor protein RapZ n=1 Tax=Marivivens niveibacter TaxID=1930667 RepID=A0A251WYU2_9RHOB|nr:RNase adapter RapZ [Marivivens niveibacter]OUD09471.1 RNase adaptor protein RapZ [Marivivens niveibacter]